MRKLLMTVALIAAFAVPIYPVHAEDAPAAEQPAVTAPAEAAPAEAKPDKPKVVTDEDLDAAKTKAIEGVKDIITSEKTGDWKKDYLYPGILLIIAIVLGWGGQAALRFGIPYLKAKSAKAGIELDQAKEDRLSNIIDNGIILMELEAAKRVTDGGEAIGGPSKAKRVVESIKKDAIVLGVDTAQEFLLSKITGRHAVLKADPNAPVS